MRVCRAYHDRVFHVSDRAVKLSEVELRAVGKREVLKHSRLRILAVVPPSGDTLPSKREMKPHPLIT